MLKLNINHSERGATLLEVLLAAVLLSLATITIALTIPKMSASIANNRRRWEASNFATAALQDLKSTPYPTLQPNQPADFGGGVAGQPGCDCSVADLSNFPVDATMSESGITYTRRICIGLVDRNGSNVGSPMCADNPLTSVTDRGLKNIRVQVSWSVGAIPYTTETEALVTR